MNKYFGYCLENGFETFETEEKAKEWAKGVLDDERLNASEDGWDEDIVCSLCWGEIKQSTTLIKRGDKIKFDGELVGCVDYQFKEPTTSNTCKE